MLRVSLLYKDILDWRAGSPNHYAVPTSHHYSTFSEGFLKWFVDSCGHLFGKNKVNINTPGLPDESGVYRQVQGRLH